MARHASRFLTSPWTDDYNHAHPGEWLICQRASQLFTVPLTAGAWVVISTLWWLMR